ncbi:hypothetical protein HPP92_001413 [Vanilla planifolia]|uniref:SAP domain-containing protein n=1 Tax=Vanilla planifolia TaxID=51239 RepID=A0A835S3B1_VANPL|nr:hypothetical protein HPP92_001413 [Vanilla planifolia]
MDDESSGSPTPTKEKRASLLGHDGVGGGASKYLKDLPSRGLFSSRFPSSNLGSIRVYVCDHDTTPPEDQVIKTNATNILIRSLQLSKQKNDAKDAKASMEVSRGKRVAARLLDGKSSAKRANTGVASSSAGSSSGLSERMLHTMTVERLRALLKERGLSPKGKKDELISRLKSDKLR